MKQSDFTTQSKFLALSTFQLPPLLKISQKLQNIHHPNLSPYFRNMTFSVTTGNCGADHKLVERYCWKIAWACQQLGGMGLVGCRGGSVNVAPQNVKILAYYIGSNLNQSLLECDVCRYRIGMQVDGDDIDLPPVVPFIDESLLSSDGSFKDYGDEFQIKVLRVPFDFEDENDKPLVGNILKELEASICSGSVEIELGHEKVFQLGCYLGIEAHLRESQYVTLSSEEGKEGAERSDEFVKYVLVINRSTVQKEREG